MLNCDFEHMIYDFKNKNYKHFIGSTTFESNLDILETIKKDYIQKLKNQNYPRDVDLTNVKIKKKIKNIDVEISVLKKENTFNISYSPKLDFLDDGSQEGEIIPINIVTTALLKSLISNNDNDDIEKLIKSISFLWI